MSYRSKVAIVYLLGFFVDLINMFIANVAYPAIGQVMRASVSQLAWVSNGYILGLTLVIPLSAWLAQRSPRERLLLAVAGATLLLYGGIVGVARPVLAVRSAAAARIAQSDAGLARLAAAPTDEE